MSALLSPLRWQSSSSIFIFTRLDINPADTWSTMLTANPFMLLLGFLIYYSAFWLRGLRWRQLIHNVGLDREQERQLA